MENGNGHKYSDEVLADKIQFVADHTYRLAAKIVEVRRMQVALRTELAEACEMGCQPDKLYEAITAVMGDDDDLLSALDSIMRVEIKNVEADIVNRVADALGLDASQIGVMRI